MATYSYKPVNSIPSTAQSSNEAASGKNRIYQVFEHTLDLDELSLPAEDNNSKGQKLENSASLQYPLIKINDYIINNTEIETMEIDSTGIVPTIMLKCTFVHQKFLSMDIPKDGDIISVAIRNKSDFLKVLRNDYIITGVASSNNNTQFLGPVTMTFFGTLFVPWISSTNFTFSHEGTSLETLKKLAKTLRLGFATNEDNTDDKQIWICSHQYTSEFISDTVNHAYKDEKSFYKWWIDIYYNLNFVNINKQLLSAESEVDAAALLDNIDKEYTYGENTKQNKVIKTPKVFSNYEGFRTNSFYINSWKPENQSTNVTFDTGTRINCNLFEHNHNLYKTDESQKFWDISVEPIYDEHKTNKYILLRGRATQDPSLRGRDLAKANYPYIDIYAKTSWQGIQYSISNPEEDNLQWDGNHHRNYKLAKVQNIMNNNELNKIDLHINVNGLNMNVIRGDKTPVVLIKKDKVENKMIDKDVGDLDLLEQFYSGWFYVKGFNIKYDRSNKYSILSNFTQKFILSRREWPPPIPVNGMETNENNT